MRVVILDAAEADLRHLKQYVTRRFGTRTWRTTSAALRKCIDGPGMHPDRGAVPPELADLPLGPYRQIVNGKTRVIYERGMDDVFVHIICVVRQDLRALLSRRLPSRR